ncbi:phosphoinositide 3-kinase adapter protein 1 isoform X2 [Anguilla anguilla]|uniref:phosphoinositide 3-kinase adapter protein 1 isoform X2 n=1 Tax=Anguilla anguilla TaxID=7936 RepID=UPI0015B27EB5|nr:phosphoinositide 3-kinase adapter protein 1 isoform X2 [Anguilla anguilla]
MSQSRGRSCGRSQSQSRSLSLSRSRSRSLMSPRKRSLGSPDPPNHPRKRKRLSRAARSAEGHLSSPPLQSRKRASPSSPTGYSVGCKMDCQARAEVEFSCQDCAPKREPGTFENDYTVRVKAPDMPSGMVLVSLYCNDSVICSRPIAYFTSMGELSSCLENITNPLDFMCQAFNITSNSTEALDNLLTESLRSRIPTRGLHIFGVSQVEEENMSTYQRSEELPTLLHFAAKFGLRKLAALLLQCPGALQAYSVANRYGDYPNNVAEKHGFSNLRQFMDEYVETADMLKSHIQDSIAQEGEEEVYESMSAASRDMLMKFSLNPGCSEEIYESMLELDPDCVEDLYEDMEKMRHEALNPEEALLRKFLLGKGDKFSTENEGEEEKEDEQEEEERGEEGEGRVAENRLSWEEEEEEDEEEDPYNLCFPDQVYDTVDELLSYVPDVTNRPPAPIPRPTVTTQPEDNKTYISRVFHEKPVGHRTTLTPGGLYSVPARPVRDRLSTTTYDPYAGMRTPGQRQLISLQERVKVGALNVEDAVLEFKSWQQNQERRSQSLRYQQENLKRLRDSITRRHKEKGRTGKDIEITGPLPRGLRGDASLQVECCVYETAPRTMTLPPVSNPPARSMQRGSWHNGSVSSVSSEGSNRLSTLSFSSGADGDLDDSVDFPIPPRPPRSDPPPVLPPPRVPPRVPERIPESPMTERYVQNPSRSRSLPRPPQRAPSPPPIPRRPR